MKEVESAVSWFEKGFSCSQAIFSTYCSKFDLDREIALKIASAFGGGMGRMGKTCGAVTGAFMVIGLKFGQMDLNDKLAKEKTYDLVKQFVQKFEARNNSIVCKELLGYDLSNPREMQLIREKNLFITLCPKFVRDAAEIIEELL